MSKKSTKKKLKKNVPKAPGSIHAGAEDKKIRKKTELKTDKDFQFLIQEPSKEETDQLEENLLKDGCIDPIIIWEDYNKILDGHHRYRICTKHGIDFKTRPMDFDSKKDAMNWIINNQLGRRNLNKSQISYLRGKRYITEKNPAHRPEKGDQNDHQKTSDKIAKDSKVGSATVRRDAKFAKAVDVIKEDVGVDFGKKILNEETKLPKSDVIKLSVKPVDEKKAIVNEMEKGAKSLSQAEKALKTANTAQMDVFDEAGPEIEFAGWSWDPHKLDAPKNTPAPH